MDALPPSLQQGLEHFWLLLGAWLDKHLINILIILIAAWLVHRFGARLITRLLHHTVRPDLYPSKIDREKRVKTLESLVRAVSQIGVYLVAAILIVGEINPVYTTALFASAGIMGIALGFGTQSLIRDFMSGIFIIAENQYRIGDTVELANVTGTVEAIAIRTTVVRDLDGSLHHIPNGTITVTTNKTIGYGQLNEDVVVAPDTDVEQLEHVVNHIGEELMALPTMKHKVLTPPRFISIKGFHDKGIIVKVAGRTSGGDQAEIRSEFYRLLIKAFQKHKIDAKLSLHSLET